MKGLSIAACIAASVIFVSVAQAKDTDLNNDTVLCLKNGSHTDELLATIYETYRDRTPKTRQISIAAGKTSCLRYYNAKKLKTDFFIKSDLGNNKFRQDKGVCNRVRGGSAKYYTLSREGNGSRNCVNNVEMSDTDIRALVANAKALNS